MSILILAQRILCPQCGIGLSGLGFLKRHWNTTHKMTSLQILTDEQFVITCNSCNKKLEVKDIERHIKEEHFTN